MIPIGAIAQMMYMWYRMNGQWASMSFKKRFGTVAMGSVAAGMTGLVLWDIEGVFNLKITPARFLFAMLTASIVGGQLVSFVATQGFSTVLSKLGMKFSKEEER